jgi:hypothetical protein
MEGAILKRLECVGSMATHPLTMPGIFAELELIRHKGLVDANAVGMETEIFKLKDFKAEGSEAFERAAMNKRNERKREAWLDATYLRNSLISWNVQIKKMSEHAEEVVPEIYALKLHPEPSSSQKSDLDDASSTATSLTPQVIREVEALLKEAIEGRILETKQIDVFEQNLPPTAHSEGDACEKIRTRLNAIYQEYEESIRDCTMRVDGMAMATQWVCSL